MYYSETYHWRQRTNHHFRSRLSSQEYKKFYGTLTLQTDASSVIRGIHLHRTRYLIKPQRYWRITQMTNLIRDQRGRSFWYLISSSETPEA